MIDYDRYGSLAEMMLEATHAFGPRDAFIQQGSRLTFDKWQALSRDLAAALHHRFGVRRAARVGVMLPNLLAFPICLLALLRLGITQVNINPHYTARELAHQLNDSGAELLILHVDALATFRAIDVPTAVRAVIIVPDDSFGPVPADAGDPPACALSEVLEAGRVLSLPEMKIAPTDIAFLQYTGGTTGPSKGAALTHRNVTANVLQFEAFSHGHFAAGEEVVMTAIPLYHIFALTVNALFMGRQGARNILIANPRDIDGMLDEWERHGVTFFTGVNTLFNVLLSNPRFAALSFDARFRAAGGGAPVQAAVSARWQAVTGRHIREGYGLSETSPILTCNPFDADRFSGAIGVALPDTEISIRDDQGRKVAAGVPGELCARGPQVMAGYWHNTVATRDAFTPDGFFKTGDIAILGADGCFRIVDRKKDMILVSGFNVYPNEVEAEVAMLDGVLECACVGVPHARTGEAVMLFVVRKDVGLTVDAVADHCRARLAAYKVPGRIEFTDALPKSAVGKILRRELREAGQEGRPS